ncbi:helix-turn-helix domain-containing protein [Aestuariivirga sp.]|uniref:helix-turn-helix domain-containing protein n=1 Tax=Aestuariivirga sp. TaxID=2650926 RepID=UPI0039E61695
MNEQIPGSVISEDSEAHFREKPDGHLDPAGEAGWFLQREREQRGLSLEDASEATGIHPYHIEAIEYGDMTRMPERSEALGMIGSYAYYLGFDPEPLVTHYAHFLPYPEMAAEAPHPANPAPLSSAKILRFAKLPAMPKFNFRLDGIPGGTGGLIASIAGAMFLFATVSYVMMTPSSEDTASAQQAQAPAADPMPTASTGTDTATVAVTDEPLPDAQAPATADADTDETAGTNLDGLTALIENNVDTKTGNLPGAKVASADDTTLTKDGREFGSRNEGSRLILKAKAPVWVRIEDQQGNVVMTQMLMKGDTYKVPNRNGLVVIARDGGLLSYVIDGKEKGILGTPGEILVGRSLDLKNLGVNS